MKKIIFIMLGLVIMLGLAELTYPSPVLAWDPHNYYKPTTVDGDYGEWNLADDFFANMYRAGNPTKELESKAYLRYDCVPNTLYVLVLTETGVPALTTGWESAAWGAIGSVSNKVYTGMSIDDGVPPDFAWVWGSYPVGGAYAAGYEASFQLDPGSWSIIVHIEVFDSSASQTSATTGSPKVSIPFEVICEGVHPLAIHINKYFSLDYDPDTQVGTWIESTIAPGPTVVEGTQLYFKFVITNSVNIPIYNLTLTDNVYATELSGITLPDYLAPEGQEGNTFTVILGPYSAEYDPNTNGLQTNRATTSGSNPDGSPTQDSEEQDLYYTVIPAQSNPSITVQKYVSYDDLTYLDANEVPGVEVELGAPVYFKFVVTNNGDTVLSNITLEDNTYDLVDIIPPLPSPFTLDPGSSYVGVIGPIYEGTGDYENDATANGYYGDTYSDTDTANFSVAGDPTVDDPHLKLVKSSTLDMSVVPPNDVANPGDKISYTLIAINDGSVTLSNVTVSDPLIATLTPSWPGTEGTLTPGQSATFTGSYTLTQADMDAGHVHNTATGRGVDAVGLEASDQDSQIVVLRGQSPEPPSPTVGGIAMPIDKVQLLIPWIALVALIVMVAAMGVVLTRRVTR